MIKPNKYPKMLYGIQLYKNCNEDDLFYILAYINDNCNYSCEYCYNKKPYSKKTLDLMRLYEFIIFIRNKYPNKYIQLELIGGEPSLHPDIMNFCNLVKNLNTNFLLKIFTNLSLSSDIYQQMLINKNIVLISSWHSTKNDKLNYTYINNAIKLLNLYKNQLEIRIMYENNNDDNSLYVANKLLPYADPQLFDISLLFNPHSAYNSNFQYYTDTQLNKFNEFLLNNNIRSNRKEFVIQYNDNTIELKTFTEMFCNKMYSFKHWLCNAGKHSIYIDVNGLIYPCVEYAYDFKNSTYNLYDKYLNQKFKFKCELCKVKYCSCDWDIKKVRINSL